MRKMSSQSKAHTAPIAIATSLGIVGMGLVSSGIAMADTVTDTINITVSPSCTFNSVSDETYVGSAANGTAVSNFNDSGVHEFNLFCNNNSGFVVTATPYDLEATGIEDVIAYTADYATSGVDSLWTANIDSDTADVTVDNSVVPVGGGTIISSNTHTAASGASFTATYEAYVGSATPAGTYTGTIVYTLSPAGSSNSGNNSNSNSGDSSDTNDVSENSDSSNSESENTNSESQALNANNTSNVTPLMSTPNVTYSTYNTTNYQSGSSAASTSGTTLTASTTSEEGSSDESNINTGNSYESPLGVTNTKTSSSKDSGAIDPAPIVVAGVLAASGIAAVALAKNKDKEEDNN